jgi:hypothetical protein
MEEEFMSCLTDLEVHAIVDGDATAASREHVMTCARCQRRVDERRRHLRDITAAIERLGDVPAELTDRVRDAITSGRAVRGSTVLRHSTSPSRWAGAGWISAAATAAGIAVLVFVVLPRFGAPTRLSASQVLERSLQTLATGTGVESLDYELTIDGVAGGPFRIKHLIDRANPNHYRVASYGTDGLLRTAISQDPARGQRTQAIQVDGRNYFVRIAGIREPVLSLPQMAQALVESIIRMMQASADPTLTTQDTPHGREYIVETPAIIPRDGALATLDLAHARTVISADDFRIHEFEGSGTLLRQPFLVSFTLLEQTVVATADANFALEPGPGDVVIDGTPGDGPIEELLTAIVREAGRGR